MVRHQWNTVRPCVGTASTGVEGTELTLDSLTFEVLRGTSLEFEFFDKNRRQPNAGLSVSDCRSVGRCGVLVIVLKLVPKIASYSYFMLFRSWNVHPLSLG